MHIECWMGLTVFFFLAFVIVSARLVRNIIRVRDAREEAAHQKARALRWRKEASEDTVARADAVADRDDEIGARLELEAKVRKFIKEVGEC